MSLYDFEEWVKKNHAESETLELIEEYKIWKATPLTNLHNDCPWIKDKDGIYTDSLMFTKEEIKDLLNHDYQISVSHEVDKENYYNCECMDWDYTLTIYIEKNDNSVLELYREGNESFSSVVSVFYEFENEGVHIWDTT